MIILQVFHLPQYEKYWILGKVYGNDTIEI